MMVIRLAGPRLVQQLLRRVEYACEQHQAHVGYFLDWLRNVRFAQDAGDLTVERAEEVIQDAEKLVEEFLEGGME